MFNNLFCFSGWDRRGKKVFPSESKIWERRKGARAMSLGMSASTRRYPSFRLNVHTHVQHFGEGISNERRREQKKKAHSGAYIYIYDFMKRSRAIWQGVGGDPFSAPARTHFFFSFLPGRALQCVTNQQTKARYPTKEWTTTNRIDSLSLSYEFSSSSGRDCEPPPRKFLKRVRIKTLSLFFFFLFYILKNWTVYITGRRFYRLRGSNLLTCGVCSIVARHWCLNESRWQPA